jgi:hypothetical protein
MKALTALLMAMTATLFFACNAPTANTTDALLKNEAQRKAVITGFMNNHDYTAELIDSLISRDHTRQMMASDKGMMHMMMTEGDITKIMGDTAAHHMMMHNMMRMMEKDSIACTAFCDKMMDDPKMKKMMQNMMEHKGMMHKGEMPKKK